MASLNSNRVLKKLGKPRKREKELNDVYYSRNYVLMILHKVPLMHRPKFLLGLPVLPVGLGPPLTRLRRRSLQVAPPRQRVGSRHAEPAVLPGTLVGIQEPHISSSTPKSSGRSQWHFQSAVAHTGHEKGMSTGSCRTLRGYKCACWPTR